MEIQDQILSNNNLRIQNNLLTKDYEILSPPIYQGPFGEIRKIKSHFHGKDRIAKIIKRELIEEDELYTIMKNIGNIQNCRKELESGTAGIMKVYEFYQDDYSYYMVQQLCDGKSLINSLLSKDIVYNEYQISKIIQSLLKTIQFGQENDIIHGNMKLTSFYWNSDNKENRHLQILDFGISTTFTTTEKVEGQYPISLPYLIAPEILEGKLFNETCDIWSIGALTYLLLTGLLPFDEGQDTSIFEEIEAGIISFEDSIWKQISVEAQDFIKQLLDINPKTRPSSKEALNHKWFQIAQNQQITFHTQPQSLATTIANIDFKRIAQYYFIMEDSITKQKLDLLARLKGFDLDNSKQITREQLIMGINDVLNQASRQQEVEQVQQKYKEKQMLNYEDYILNNYLREKQNLLNSIQDQLKSFKQKTQKNNVNLDKIAFYPNEIKKIIGQAKYLEMKIQLSKHENLDGKIGCKQVEEVILAFVKKDVQQDDISQYFNNVEYSQAQCNCQCNIF